MNPLTLEWIEKAEGDFATAQREQRARKMPNYDAVCFHRPMSYVPTERTYPRVLTQGS